MRRTLSLPKAVLQLRLLCVDESHATTPVAGRLLASVPGVRRMVEESHPLRSIRHDVFVVTQVESLTVEMPFPGSVSAPPPPVLAQNWHWCAGIAGTPAMACQALLTFLRHGSSTLLGVITPSAWPYSGTATHTVESCYYFEHRSHDSDVRRRHRWVQVPYYTLLG